jgi:hypothetical protein
MTLQGRAVFRAVLMMLGVSVLGAGACKATHEDLPTTPAATPAPLIPIAPIGSELQPTPRPTPLGPGSPGSPPPDGEPFPGDPGGGGGGGGSGSCSDPQPGPLAKIDVKVHIQGAGRTILDASPLVGPDEAFCKAIGFTDGRRYCPPRTEGNPERGACDAALMGTAADTGRVGPTWRVNGGPCVFANGCENHPDNQFLAFAYGPGTYQACASSGICGTLVLAQ